MKTTGKVINNTSENQADISAMNEKELMIFTILRNSMLEIFPLNENNTFYEESIRLSECFAIIASKGIKQYIDNEINEFKTSYAHEIEEMLTNMGINMPS